MNLLTFNSLTSCFNVNLKMNKNEFIILFSMRKKTFTTCAKKIFEKSNTIKAERI